MQRPPSDTTKHRTLTAKDMEELAKANVKLIIQLINNHEESDPTSPVLSNIESLLVGSIKLMDEAQRKVVLDFISRSEFVNETDSTVQATLKKITRLLTATPLPPKPKPTMPLSEDEQDKLRSYILANPRDFHGRNSDGKEYWVPTDGTGGLSFEAIDKDNIQVFVHPYNNLKYKPIGEFSLDVKTAREYINKPKKKIIEENAEPESPRFIEREKTPPRQRINLFSESITRPLTVSEDEKRLAAKCIERNWRDYMDKGVKSDGTSKVSIGEQLENNKFSFIVSYPGWVGLKTRVYSISTADIKNLAAEEEQYQQSKKHR